MRLCSSATPGTPYPVSADLFYVVCSAQHYAQVSRGAFDVTVGPLVQLWRAARRKRELPQPEQLAEAIARSGYHCLTLDQSKRTITLHREKMRLDLGGIAKGFAGDAALAVLRQHGCGRALVDCGGDVVAGDPPPGRDGWVIGIAPLTDPQGKPSRYLSIRNQSVATSGDAFHYSEIDGVRYSHIVNPKTGLGLTRRSSVSVIAPSGIAADALASAVSVLGCEQGLAVIDQSPDHAALFVEMSDDGPLATASRRLKCYEVTP